MSSNKNIHKLVFTDENDLRIYESLPPTDFKEFFMAYFKYHKGDNIEITDFTNPVTFALFNSYIPKIDKNEEEYLKKDKRSNTSAENGKKGGRPKKLTLQEVKSTEFDTPKQEIENKPILSPQNIQDDNLYHPEGESASNGLKIGKNEVLKDDNENNIDDMGNLLVFNQATGKYEYPNKTKEEIKEKVIKNSLPTVKIAATAQTPSIPTFEEVLKDEKDTIEDIINDFNAGGMKSRLQAPTRLNELLNRKWGRYYKEQITEYINNRRIA